MYDGKVKSHQHEDPAKACNTQTTEESLVPPGVTVPMLAAIRIAEDTPTDQLLLSVVHALQAEGRSVAGFIQCKGRKDASGHAEMMLEDIVSGQRICISQPLGRGSRGCRLHPGAVAGIAGPFIEAIETGPDLLVLNRFGKGESEGQGFRSVLEKAYLLGIPVLTSVKPAYLDAWQKFAGNCSTLLPPLRETLLDWSRTVVGSSPANSGDMQHSTGVHSATRFV